MSCPCSSTGASGPAYGSTLYFPAGTSARFRFGARQFATGQPLDLTGGTLALYLKTAETVADADAALTATTTNGKLVVMDALLGLFDWVVAPGDTSPTAYTAGDPWFRYVKFTNADGEVYVLAGSAGDVVLDAVTPAVGNAGQQIAYAPTVTAEAIGPESSPVPAYATIAYVDDELAGAISTHNSAPTAHGQTATGRALVTAANVSASRTSLGLGACDQVAFDQVTATDLVANNNIGINGRELTASGTGDLAFPSTGGTLALAATTLAGYGITDGQPLNANLTAYADAADAAARRALISASETGSVYSLAGGQAHRKLMSIASGTTAQLRVLSFGDSLEYFKPRAMLPDLVAAYGRAGQVGSAAVILSGGAAAGTQDFTIFPTGENWTLPSGGTITWSYGSTNSILSDTMILLYLKSPGSGNFGVKTSLAGASFVDESGYTNVDANTTAGIGVITLSKTAGAYRAQVVGLSGTVKFFRPLFRHTTKSGIEWYQMGCAGATLTQMNTVPSAYMATILGAIAPDLVTFEMREVSDEPQVAAFSAQLVELQTRFDSVVPYASWIFSGAPPMSDPTSDARTIVTNATLKAHALANGRYYFDGYGACKNWANVNALGWGNDGVHLADAAQRFLGERCRRESGLTAGLSLGAFGSSYGTEPQNTLVATGDASGRPYVRLARASGSLSFWASRVLGASANNRGLEFQATNLQIEGQEQWATGLEVFPLHGYLGQPRSGIAVGGVTPAGLALIEFPNTFNSARDSGMSWGSGNTIHYNSGTDAIKVTGMDFEMPSSTQSLVLVSPNSTRYRLTVSDAGVLSTTAL